jgi:hypothetical protein
MGPHTSADTEREEAVSDHEPRRRDEDGENVFALVAQLARRASDGQLVVAAAIGIVAAALVGLVRPDLWFVGLPLLCVGSFGVWGIAERTATERTARLGADFGGRRAHERPPNGSHRHVSGLLTILVIVADGRNLEDDPFVRGPFVLDASAARTDRHPETGTHPEQRFWIRALRCEWTA